MRFSPQGTLLAIAGAGPIELWDPMAHNLVAVLRMNTIRQPTWRFAPDGQTLAAVGRAAVTSVWTVQDSAARTQLSGFDSRPRLWLSAPTECWPAEAGAATSGSGAMAGARNSATDCRRPAACRPTTSEQPEPDADGRQPPGPRRHAEGGARSAATATGRTNRGDQTEFDRSVLTFDGQGRLVAHDAQGLRIWPAGSISAQTPPDDQRPLPRVPGNGPLRIASHGQNG